MTFEALLQSQQFKQALFDVQAAECDRLEAEFALEPVAFSQKFERKMERLLRAQRKPYYPLVNTSLKRAVLAAVIALIILITTVFSVSALRESVIRFFVEVREKFSQVFFNQQEEEVFPSTLEIYYVPTWLPEGYWEDAARTVYAVILCERTYVDDRGEEINFKQYTITSLVLRIDTEGVEAETVIINGNKGLYFSNKEIRHLTWINEHCGFSVSGSVSKADLVRFAESIQPE